MSLSMSNSASRVNLMVNASKELNPNGLKISPRLYLMTSSRNMTYLLFPFVGRIKNLEMTSVGTLIMA